MRRSVTRGIAVAGLALAMGLGLAGTASAHDSYGSYSYSWSPSTLAAKFEAKADYLRYKANRVEYTIVLNDAQQDVLQARLRATANDLDALATETRTLTAQEQLDAAYAEYKAELAAIAPTLRAAKQAFYGTALRYKARWLASKAASLQAKLDTLEAAGDVGAEDAVAIQAAIDAARAKIALVRARLVPSVVGVQIMSDPDAASGTLSLAAKRLYGASYWLRTAAYAIYSLT